MAEERDDKSSDMEAVQAFIKEQVQAFAREEFRRHTQESRPDATQRDTEIARKQLGDLITPFVKPDIDRATLTAQDAMDRVDFYLNNPEAAEYKDQVEETFTALVKAGRPFPRRDILDNLIGKEFRADPAKFREKMDSRQKAELDKARDGGDFGLGSWDKAKADSKWGSFDKLSLEEMEKALEGITF